MTQLDPKQFAASLFELMRNRGEQIEQIPFIDGKEVDLYHLYQLVAVSGGSQKVS